MSLKKPEEQPSGRRRFLQKSLSIIPLAAAASTGVVSLSSPAADKPQGVLSDYVPAYFNDKEWKFLLAALDRLIPADANGPGAVSEGVQVFIDKQMELPYGYGRLWYMQGPFADAIPEMGYQSHLVPRDTYRLGIAMADQHCQQQYQKDFYQLETAQQEEVLRALEADKLRNDAIHGKLFFEQLLENAKEGYLADPIHGGNQTLASWKMIGFPGARADFTDTVQQPNKPYPLGPVSISSKRSV